MLNGSSRLGSVGRLRMVAAVAVVCFLACVPLSGNQYVVYLCSLALAYSLAATGLNVLMGFGPIISIGHAGFFAVGAYVAAIAMTDHGLGLAPALSLAGLVGAVVGATVALPALRLAGLYLAIATLAFGLVVERFIASTPDLTGGPNGMGVFTTLTTDQLFYVILTVTVVLTLAYRNIVLGGFGDLLQSMRDHPIAAQSMGVNLARIKIAAFSMSASYAAVGGGLYACLVSYIVGSSFDMDLSLLFILMVMLGGAGSVYGPVAGAAFVVALPEVMKGVDWGQDLVYGIAIVLIVLFAPRGLVGVARPLALRLLGRPLPVISV